MSDRKKTVETWRGWFKKNHLHNIDDAQIDAIKLGAMVPGHQVWDFTRYGFDSPEGDWAERTEFIMHAIVEDGLLIMTFRFYSGKGWLQWKLHGAALIFPDVAVTLSSD